MQKSSHVCFCSGVNIKKPNTQFEKMDNLIDSLKALIGENHRNIAFSIGAIYVTVKVCSKIKERLEFCKYQQMLKEWELNAPKDVVILHTVPYGATVPHPSQFVLKVETFLRMHNIPYQLDFKNPWGPLRKMPWITFNGQHIADSQIILDFLRKKFNIKDANYTEEQIAIATPVRIMVDEYLYWGLMLWRYVHSNGKGLDQIINIPKPAIKALFRFGHPLTKNYGWAQGLGRHSPDQVTKMTKDGLKSLSIILGNKLFLLGNKPCEEDCAVFGCLIQFLWAAPGSPYEKYIIEELVNLHEYCNRMKSLYWSDWDKCLTKNPEDGCFKL